MSMHYKYIDQADVEEYIAQGWTVTYLKDYLTHGHPRACFLACGPHI